jgi:hypothetical protein
MYIVGIWMYVEVGIDVERTGDKVLCQCTCIGREDLLAYLVGLPLIKCTWKENIMALINDLTYPPEAPKLSG